MQTAIQRDRAGARREARIVMLNGGGNRRTEKLLLGAFLVGLLALVGVGLLSYRNTSSLIDNNRLVTHTQEVLTELEGVESAVQGAESSQRGYLITGDDTYLAPYTSALGTVPASVDHLQQLTSDNLAQQARIPALRASIKTRLDLLAEGIRQRSRAGFGAAQSFTRVGAGKAAMDTVTQIVAQMEGEERTLLAERIKTAEASAVGTIIAFSGLTTLGLLLLGAVYWGTLRYLAERRQVEREVRALNESLEGRVEERTAQLREANDELEAFAYSVSHDLRAPLRAVTGFSNAVLEDYGDRLDDEGRRYLDRIKRGGEQMGRLIDDLLTFSRMGRLPMEEKDIDMAALAQEVYDELTFSNKGSNKGRNIQFKLDILPPARGDRALLRQVFVNLLSNALKFSKDRETAQIEVGGRKEGGENLYYVRDNGAGFDMKYADKLFGVFQRLHSASEFDGTGAGLAIVQRIVKRHGGRVWAEGQVGQGATFYFTLPIAPIAPIAPQDGGTA